MMRTDERRKRSSAKYLPDCDSSCELLRVASYGWSNTVGSRIQYSVLGTQWRSASLAGRPKAAVPWAVPGPSSHGWIEATVSVGVRCVTGTGSFLDGAKVFSSLIWGEGIWGAEMGLGGAKRLVDAGVADCGGFG